MVASGSPSLPFYYYHIPGLTGVDHLPMDEFYSLAVDRIKNFRGIKFSSTDVVVLGSCLKIRNPLPDHDLFWGVDEAINIAADHGLDACIGSTYNMVLGASCHSCCSSSVFSSSDSSSSDSSFSDFYSQLA